MSRHCRTPLLDASSNVAMIKTCFKQLVGLYEKQRPLTDQSDDSICYKYVLNYVIALVRVETCVSMYSDTIACTMRV